MLKANILKKNHEFQNIIENKKQFVSKTLILYFTSSQESLKVGISISKKFANAVHRNKYRRQIRNILDELKFWHLKYDVVLILRKSFFSKSYENKKSEVKALFERFHEK